MEESKTNLSVLRKQRIDKISKLKILGINPYPSKPRKEHNIGDLIKDFSKYEDKYVYITDRFTAEFPVTITIRALLFKIVALHLYSMDYFK